MAVSILPASGRDRIDALDTLRGFAVLGILVMNIMGMGLPLHAYNHPTAFGGFEGADYWNWLVANVFVEGAMRALFAGLFGAGFLLLVERLEERGAGLAAADIHFRRVLFLAGFGLIDIYIFYWGGDVLFTYAILGALIFPFRKLPAKWLLAAGAGLLLVNAYTQNNWHSTLVDSRAAHEQAQEAGTPADDEEYEARTAAWTGYAELGRPGRDALDYEIDLRRSGYLEQFRENFTRSTEVQRNQLFFMLLPNPDSLMAMLLGMALMKLGLLTGRAPLRRCLVLLGVGYGVGIPVSLWETMSYANSGFDMLAHARTGVTYDLGRLAMAGGHAALVLMLCRWGRLGALGRIISAGLASVGRMALSNYLLHSIIALFVFTGAGLALYGTFSRSELILVMLGVWAVNIAFSVIWLKRYRFGPAEWLWRSLTYWKLQPLRRGEASAA